MIKTINQIQYWICWGTFWFAIVNIAGALWFEYKGDPVDPQFYLWATIGILWSLYWIKRFGGKR
jgi:hypothetical protein